MNKLAELFTIVFFGVLLLAFATPPLSNADDHKDGAKHFLKHDGKKAPRNLGAPFGRGRDKGNETTGQMVAWSLGAVNLTVVISLIIRAIRRFAPLDQEVKKSIWKFNSLQKKHLMRFHYVLNPLIFGIALLHWSLSRCSSTSLPEWGLFTMALMVTLGTILKFKLCPQGFLRSIYKVHTQPVLVIFLVSILVIGHLLVD